MYILVSEIPPNTRGKYKEAADPKYGLRQQYTSNSSSSRESFPYLFTQDGYRSIADVSIKCSERM